MDCWDLTCIRYVDSFKDFWSVRVSGNWRTIFRFERTEVVDVDLVDYH